MEETTLAKVYKYINNFKEVLDFLSFHNFEMPSFLSYRHLWLSITPGINSSIKTLDAIKKLIEINDFIDAYVLIRKLRDNLLFDCVIAQDAESNHPELTDDFFKPFLNENNGFDLSKLEAALDRFVLANTIYEIDNEDKDRIEKWRKNNVRYKNGEKDKWIGYYEFKCKLETNLNILEINRKYLDKHLSFLQKQTNSYVHTLSFEYSNNYSKTNKEHLECIYSLLRIIKFTLISYLMLIKSRLFASADYTDYLECGVEPPEGSQYWIAPLISDVLAEIKGVNKGLYHYLKENNTNCMVFEETVPDA